MISTFIPIAIATDKNYVEPALVLVTSILENKGEDTHIEFNVMISDDVENENKEKFKILVSKYKCSNVIFHNMGSAYKEYDFYTNHYYAKPASFYRLSLPSVLPKYEKVIYLDIDTIVNSDLSEMLNTNLDNYYVAGVSELKLALKSINIDGVNNKVKVSKFTPICSGVLIMNLKKMREDKIEEKFKKYLKSVDCKKFEKLCLDQDAVNFVCMDKIKLIHPKYSMFSFEYKNPKAMTLPNIYKSVLTQEEWDDAVKNPAIFHFNSSTKPWKYSSTDPYPINVWHKYKNIKDKKLGLASKCV